ncbi:C-reactive protein-like [Plectropomus leopardus]|uniref:C-reactive protein-like n=1 Tax=Plectropomus leopardus TaxID=160734 RepID=UPI001C4CA693|nr:C-reactive protein-like [Plectropomus leopardus]
MKRLILLMVMFATCCAKPEDLSGKVFVFPKETKTDHVKLQTSQTEFSSVTACLRFQTDLTRNYGLFSLATTAHSNAFLLFKRESVDVIDVEARDGKADFGSLSFPRNTWHSVCATWRSDNGVAQVWMDGKATIKRFIRTRAITGAPITILGQEQDAYGGNFDEAQSFIGMITDVHMWDQVLPASEIKRYMAYKHFTPGNVFNWGALEYDITGDILVEEESEVM